jgi:hypothetical protein
LGFLIALVLAIGIETIDCEHEHGILKPEGLVNSSPRFAKPWGCRTRQWPNPEGG